MSLSSLEKKILAYLQENPEQKFKTDELANHFNFKGSKNYKKLIKALAFLERIHEIQVTKTGLFQYAGKVKEEVVGIFRSNDRGFGFINYDEDATDLFVPPGKIGAAMNGDKVRATILKHVDPTTGKGSEARIDHIIERSASQLVGEFIAYDQDLRQETAFLGYVIPQGDYSSSMKIQIAADGIHPAANSIVLVEIKEYPTVEQPNDLTGLVVKEIGHKDAPGVDILAILYQFDIPHEFPEEVLKQAENIPQEVNAEEIKGRRDLRNQLIITIDGESAKDIDDAISLKQLENGNYLLAVHIADVSHYVQENTPIDQEALRRGTSVYLTDRVVPMLPQRLSNGICSLLPNEDRLTVTAEMQIDNTGNIVESDIYLSAINSSYRMTYDDVNAILDGDEALSNKYTELLPMLHDMSDLHKLLEEKRLKRGALNFETKEAEFVVDEEGRPLDIIVRERGLGERLIESFMLAANESIAWAYREKDWPMIYRIHEQPDEDRMKTFAEFITSFGVVLRGRADSIKPKQLQEALGQFKGTPYETVISMMMLRSMQQARYSNEPLGHYGLAAKDYTHFTAPIRRYPDLIVHRLIHRYLEERPSESEQAKIALKLPDIAEHSSKMERRSVEAERETDSLKKAEYMLDKVGQQFEGIISSVTSFGIFVQLPNTVEGLIAIHDLKDDYYNYNPQHLILIGDRTNKVYRIGQKVVIEVEKVSIEDREIDFQLIEAYPTDNKDLEHLQKDNRQKRRRKSTQRRHESQSKENKAQTQQARRKATRKNKGKKQFQIRKRKS